MIARTDVELVEASLRGEHQAFGHLVARYQDVVCAVSYSSTGDRNLSEDVAQETFIAAWSQLDRLRDKSVVRSWLCGMARNIARKARKRLRREELVDSDDQAAEGTPFVDAARGDAERIVREALSRIPEGCREVLVLYYREDLSVREIAETLGTNEVAVMQRLSRGRRYLADSVTDLVERSLRGERRRRDLVAAVLASIAAIAIPSRVDASPLKGSTMLKFALAASAVAIVGGAAYLVHDKVTAKAAQSRSAPEALHFGAGKLGLAHAPTLGPTAAPRAIHSRSVAQSDLALLPADAEAVIGINFAQVRDSALWKRFVAPQLAHNEVISKFENMCGFDPLAALGTISLGLKGIAGDEVTGTIVIHGLDKTKMMTCLEKHGMDDAKETGEKVTYDRGVALITGKKQSVGFTFLDDSTWLIVLGPEAATRDSVLRVAAGGGTLATSSAFTETLQFVNTDDSLWVMVDGRSPALAAANLALSRFTPTQVGGMYLAVNITDSLALDAGMRLGSPEAVATLVATAQQRLTVPEVQAAISPLFDQFDIAADGSDLIVSLAMSGDQIGKLMSSVNGNVQVTTN
jgi:RNA polymerase sigma factor (sigma-70 family)